MKMEAWDEWDGVIMRTKVRRTTGCFFSEKLDRIFVFHFRACNGEMVSLDLELVRTHIGLKI